jgi:rhodanese-related sulfurtransferase
MSFREIDPTAALDEIQATPDLQLLDVREPWEHEKIHIEGVQLIPLGELGDRYGEVDPSRPVLCICAGGVRSERAARFLASKGYHGVINMAEGMKGWESRGLPTRLSANP